MSAMLRAVLSALLGALPESEGEAGARRLGEELAKHATDWKRARAGARAQRELIELLSFEARTWKQRLDVARQSGDRALIEAAARAAGRNDGHLEQARLELDRFTRQELFAHECLDAHRGKFLRMVRDLRAIGRHVDDFGLGAVYDDAGPATVELPADDEGEFVARLIDRMRASVSR